MGLFTRFKALSSWTVQELLEENVRLSKLEFDYLFSGPEYEKIKIKTNEIENEFSRRGLNLSEETNKKLRTFKR